LVYLLQNTLKLFGFPTFLTVNVPDVGYSRNASCTLNQIYTINTTGPTREEGTASGAHAFTSVFSGVRVTL